MRHVPPKKFWDKFREANANRAEVAFHAISSWPTRHWQQCLVFEAGEVGNLLKKLQRFHSGMYDVRVQPCALPQEIGQEIVDCLTYLDLYWWSVGMPILIPSEGRVQHWIDDFQILSPLDAGWELVQSIMHGCGQTPAILLALHYCYGDTRYDTFEEVVCAKFNHVSDRVGCSIKLDAKELIHAD